MDDCHGGSGTIDVSGRPCEMRSRQRLRFRGWSLADYLLLHAQIPPGRRRVRIPVHYQCQAIDVEAYSN